MNLKGNSATFYLNESGKTFLYSTMVNDLPVWDLGDGRHGIVAADVEESEDLGVWLRFERDSISKFFLLRREFIDGIEFNNDEKRKVIGLRG